MEMTDGHHVLFLVEVAAGVVIGFLLWSYIQPTIFSATTTATPAA